MFEITETMKKKLSEHRYNHWRIPKQVENMNLSLFGCHAKVLDDANVPEKEQNEFECWQIVDRWRWLTYTMLFQFDGTITIEELIDRIIMWLMPSWDDDGITAWYWRGTDKCPTEMIDHIRKEMFNDIREAWNASYELIDRVDSEMSEKIIEHMVA